MAVTDHRYIDTSVPAFWVVATDRVMSGRQVPGKSYVAYPAYSSKDERELVRWMKEDRADFIRVRVNLELPRLSGNDHLSLYDRPWMEDDNA